MVNLTYQAGGYKETILRNVPLPIARWKMKQLKALTQFKLGTFKIEKV
jgi:hypothetical protein